MGDLAIEPSHPRMHLRGGLTYGQNTPGAKAIQSTFTNEGMTIGAPPAFGGQVSWGVDIVSTPISRRGLITVSTEVDLGLSIQNAVSAVPNKPDGYLFKQQRIQGTMAKTVAVGYVHTFDNGLYAAGAIRNTVHLIGPERMDSGVRLEAGKKLGGMVQVAKQVVGEGRGDVSVTAGVVLNL